MSKATEQELATLHGAIARGLTEIVSEGVTIVDKEGEAVKLPASAAYYMAAITFAKNNNITADAAANEDLAALNRALAEKRKTQKAKLSPRAVSLVADEFDRDLGGHLQ